MRARNLKETIRNKIHTIVHLVKLGLCTTDIARFFSIFCLPRSTRTLLGFSQSRHILYPHTLWPSKGLLALFNIYLIDANVILAKMDGCCRYEELLFRSSISTRVCLASKMHLQQHHKLAMFCRFVVDLKECSDRHVNIKPFAFLHFLRSKSAPSGSVTIFNLIISSCWHKRAELHNSCSLRVDSKSTEEKEKNWRRRSSHRQCT